MSRSENLIVTARHFLPAAAITDVRPFGNGLINDSYFVGTADPKDPGYILQRINHAIFRNVELLQGNILAVTSHIRRKLRERGEPDIDRKVLDFIVAPDGKSYFFDGGSYWRMMKFIPGSTSHETVTAASSRSAGAAFGNFQRMLSDIPAELGETIPSFHDMEYRLAQFRDAVDRDAAGRVKHLGELIDQVERHAESMCRAQRWHREGKLPKRVCHCDTKVNNILFDSNGGGILCVVDLDTVMPSFIFSDYGDFMRTAANTGAEDDPDLENVGLNIPIFEAFTEGYLGSARDFLTPLEIDNLPYAAALFPYMQAVRFLTDHVDNDTYYKIAYPGHNLVRAKAQFRLLESMEQNEELMRDFIEKCMQRL